MQSRSATSIGLLVCIPHRFLAKFFLLTLSPHDLRLLPRVPLLLLRIAYFSLLVLKVLRLTRLRKNCRRDCLRTLLRVLHLSLLPVLPPSNVLRRSLTLFLLPFRRLLLARPFTSLRTTSTHLFSNTGTTR
mmetsp:Transcript_6545/g.23220  ORF Transcript_6545/g.23220 Transcript_6545/m.23220 type:complete len:131 (+) Transcript_6545:670-1062(+)